VRGAGGGGAEARDGGGEVPGAAVGGVELEGEGAGGGEGEEFGCGGECAGNVWALWLGSVGVRRVMMWMGTMGSWRKRSFRMRIACS